MASWFTQALDKITPWDRGGEVQRRKEKQQQDLNKPKIVRPTPNLGVTTNADKNLNAIKGDQKKKASFGTLDMPNKVKVPNKIADAKQSEIKQPSNVEIAARSLGSVNADIYGGIAGIAKSAVELPAMAANATNYIGLGAAKLSGNNPAAARAEERIANNKIANKYIEKVKPITSKLETAEKATDLVGQKLAPWKTENQKNATKAFTNVIPTPSAVAGTVAGVKAISTANKVNKANKAAKAAQDAAKLAEEAKKLEAAKRVTVPIKGGDKTPLPIPTRVATGPTIEDVTQRLPGDKPALAPTKKPVKRESEPQRLIQDVGGGESFPTPDALVQRNIDQARREAADRFNSVDTGNMADVTPRTEAPTKLPDTEAERQKLIDLYAKDLKSRGEGNGVELVPDGDPIGYGMKRVSNNVRSKEIGSKRMTKANWQDEAERQLKAGQADPGTQQAFNDLTDPEVQSLLAQGEQIPGSQGIPIRVKQVQGIDVQQGADIPVNTPETPGTVRVTTKTDPVQAQTEAVAAQPTVVTPESIPLPKVGALLPDGTKVTKAMVKAARNQRKLAKQLAKTKADTQAVVDGMPGRNSNTPVNNIEQTIQSNKETAASKGYESTDLIGKDYNDGMNQKVISEDDFRTNKSVEGRTVIGGVFKAGDNTDEQLVLYRIDHTPESAANRIAQLEKVKQFMGELPPELQKELDTLRPPQTNPGFVPTGEFRKGANGNVYEVAHKSTERAQAASDTATMSAEEVITKAAQENDTVAGLTDESIRNIISLQESGRYAPGSPQAVALESLLDGAGSKAGQRLSLFNKTIRRLAKGDTLANRFINKVYKSAEDGSRMTEGHIQAIRQAENTFTDARDTATQALNQYNATKSAEDFAVWKQAQQAAEEAEKHALITEYRVANDVLKGNKNPEALKAVMQAEKDAGVYQMDWVDANMLSGTGTGVRNYFNTSGIRLENSIFGRMAGGYSGKGSKIGNKLGNKSVVSDFKARNELDQNILSKSIKQWSTTMNTLGEGNIKAVANARAYKYYEKQLKSQGVAGDQLKRDVEVMLHTDPDGAVAHYEGWAMQENALSALAHSKKFEQQLADMIAGKGYGKAAQTAAKVAVRLTVGFPTVIGRSLVGGAKRATLGVPEAIHAAFVKGDPLKQADLLYNAKVHGGSGAMLYALGAGLAAKGVISGAYPEDQAERDQWKREGRQSNSINIAGNWFSIPGYFGALALPLLVPAYIKDARSPGEITKGIADAIMSLSPTDSAAKFFAGMDGRGGEQWGKNMATSAVRAVTPAGALLNQLARMTDTTKNDTTTKSDIMNLLDSIAGGIPGINNMVNKIDATDDQGNVLHNPAVWATAVGASGQDQQAGIEDSQEMQTQANETYASLRDLGVLSNETLMSLVDPKLQSQIARGQDLTPEQVTDIQKTVVAGITTGTGPDSDSNWRQNGDYSTDRIALQTKLQMLEADPRAKNSDIAGLKMQLARTDVLEKNQIPFEQLELYQKTSQTDWASMGKQYNKDGTPNEDYDPDTYNLLLNIDNLMTEVGGSYKESHPDKNKYNPKGAGTGYGSGSGRKAPKMDASFGTLSTSGNPMAPKVRQYETANMAGTSGIPVINVVRPNIVHKIGRG